MATLKAVTYANTQDVSIDFGDPDLDKSLGDQLKITTKELVNAVNKEQLADKLFGQVLLARSAAQKELLRKLPLQQAPTPQHFPLDEG